MKAFSCDSCGSLVFFENVQCVKCQSPLGFLPEFGDLSALRPGNDGSWIALAPAAKGSHYRTCANGSQHKVCNWMVPGANPDPFCAACRLNETIPDLAVAGNRERWYKLELAKRRIVYSLLRLHLPTEGVPSENKPPLRFSFLASSLGQPPVVTGHCAGRITINISEADDDERERVRARLHEPYRTLLGHLRHEVAHYYWERMIADSSMLPRFRSLFGEETGDYPEALQEYYQDGPPAEWPARFVSAYASAHPWEDWAETWAHYLHLEDALETAAAFGLTLRPDHPAAKTMTTTPTEGVFGNFDRMVVNWLPLTHALNTFNRGMGLPDLYPFVLSTPVIEKLRFVHEVIGTRPAERAHLPAK